MDGAGRAFTKHYKLDTSVGRRFVAYMDDGVLCIKMCEGVETNPVPQEKDVPARVERDPTRGHRIRLWAVENGLPSGPPSPGRIPQSVVDAYEDAHRQQ